MGDVMRRNINGTIDFIDRKKYLIKSGGENIYPAEIERILLAHKEVLEAIVVKVKSLKWGESPVALISIIDQKDFKIIKKELLDTINDRLAGYKRPYEILKIDADDIPRSTTGKVQRHLVEEMVEGIIKKEYKES